jgi:hypothetical protein
VLVQAEVPLTRIAQDGDDPLARAQLASYLARDAHIGAGRDTDKETLFPREAHLGFVCIAVAYVANLIHHLAVEGSGHKAGSDPLQLVRARRPASENP